MNRGLHRPAAGAADAPRRPTMPTQVARGGGSGLVRQTPGAGDRIVVVPPGQVPAGAEVLAVVVLLAGVPDRPGPGVPARALGLATSARNGAGADLGVVDVCVAREGLVIDRPGRVVRVGADVVELTRREFDLLDHVCSRPGRVYTRDQLLAAVWGPDRAAAGGPRTVDVHVARIRRKLGPHAGAFETVRGVGYRWVP